MDTLISAKMALILKQGLDYWVDPVPHDDSPGEAIHPNLHLSLGAGFKGFRFGFLRKADSFLLAFQVFIKHWTNWSVVQTSLDSHWNGTHFHSNQCQWTHGLEKVSTLFEKWISRIFQGWNDIFQALWNPYLAYCKCIIQWWITCHTQMNNIHSLQFNHTKTTNFTQNRFDFIMVYQSCRIPFFSNQMCKMHKKTHRD